MAPASTTAVLAVPDRSAAERPESKAPDGSEGQFAGLMAHFVPPQPKLPTPESAPAQRRSAERTGERSTDRPAEPRSRSEASERTRSSAAGTAADRTAETREKAARSDSPAETRDAAETPTNSADDAKATQAAAQGDAQNGAKTEAATASAQPTQPASATAPIPGAVPATLPTVISATPLGAAASETQAAAQGPAQRQAQAAAQLQAQAAARPRSTGSELPGAASKVAADSQAQFEGAAAQAAETEATAPAPSAPAFTQAVLAEPAPKPTGTKPSDTTPKLPAAEAQPARARTEPQAPLVSITHQEGEASEPVPTPANPALRVQEKVLPGLAEPATPSTPAAEGPVKGTLAAMGLEGGKLGSEPTLTKLASSAQAPASAQPEAGSALAALATSRAASAAPASTTPVASPQAGPAPNPPTAQVEGSVRWMLKGGAQEAKLQLHPESLGQVTIHLKVEGGEVHARLWITEPASVQAVQEGRPHLEQSLREQGLQLGSFDLQQGQRPFQEAPSAPTFRGSLPSDPVVARQEAPALPAPSILNPHHVELYA